MSRQQMRRRRRRQGQAQALVEFAMLLPLLALLALGVADLGRAYRYAISVVAQSRAGVRAAVNGATEEAILNKRDVSTAIRAEPSSVIPNTLAAWGPEMGGQSRDCDVKAGHGCGDATNPNVCSALTQDACFAVRYCNYTDVNTSGGCNVWQPWGAGHSAARNTPLLGQTDLVDVRVVYRMKGVTPLITGLFGSHGALIISRDSYSYVNY